MTLSLPYYAALWETVAAIQVCQAYGCADLEGNAEGEASRLLYLAQIAQWPSVGLQGPTARLLDIGGAYRQAAASEGTYPALLAATAGLTGKSIKAPVFPNLKLDDGPPGGIVVSPFEVIDSFRLTWKIWQQIIRHLRSYGLEVSLLGRPSQRADYGNFTEGTILSELPVDEKLARLARARLVLGVPNEWTWIAAGFGTKVIVMHPDDLPHPRWFGFDVQPRSLGRLLYQAQQLQTAVILAGLRRLIDAM